MPNKKYIRVTNISLALMAIAFGIMLSHLGLQNSSANGPNSTNCDETIDMRQNCAHPNGGATLTATYLGGTYPTCAMTNNFAGSQYPICCQYSTRTKFCDWSVPAPYGTGTYPQTTSSGYLATLSSQWVRYNCNGGLCEP
jgi:hypothetical protein